MTVHDHDQLLAQRDRILQDIAGIGDLRQGSLRTQYRKCGKPNCHCAGDGAKGHGPYWLLTWMDKARNKTRGRTVPADAVEETRAQIAEYRRLRGLMQELIAVSPRICDARLDAARCSRQDSAAGTLARKVKPAAAKSPKRLDPRAASGTAAAFR